MFEPPKSGPIRLDRRLARTQTLSLCAAIYLASDEANKLSPKSARAKSRQGHGPRHRKGLQTGSLAYTPSLALLMSSPVVWLVVVW
jgi:hypothetical protein